MRLKLSGTDRKAVGHGSPACLSALTLWPCPVASGPHSPLWLQPHACLRSPKQDVSTQCCAFLGLYAARPRSQSEHVQMSICPQPGPGRMDQTPAVPSRCEGRGPPPHPPSHSHRLRVGHCLVSPCRRAKRCLWCALVLLCGSLAGLPIKAKICISFPTSAQKEEGKFIPFLSLSAAVRFLREEHEQTQLSSRKRPEPAMAGVRRPRPNSGLRF